MRRFPQLIAFAALGVSLSLPASALLSCLADQSDTAMAQMACCKSGKPDCGQSSGALQCCKTAERPQQQNLVKGLSVVNPLRIQPSALVVTGVAQVALPLTLLQSPPPVVLFAGTTSPPRLAFSSLLI